MPKGSGGKSSKWDIYLILAGLLTVANFTYWCMYAINAHNIFHEYEDLGAFAFDMFYHLHYPNIVWGLQYLIFGNHIAPDLILMVPLYAIFQSPLTLLFIQAAVLSVTGLVLFIVARELIKDNKLALLLSIAYFLNPGIHGMFIFDFHAESLIILLYLLTFYFLHEKKSEIDACLAVVAIRKHRSRTILGRDARTWPYSVRDEIHQRQSS